MASTSVNIEILKQELISFVDARLDFNHLQIREKRYSLSDELITLDAVKDPSVVVMRVKERLRALEERMQGGSSSFFMRSENMYMLWEWSQLHAWLALVLIYRSTASRPENLRKIFPHLQESMKGLESLTHKNRWFARIFPWSLAARAHRTCQFYLSSFHQHLCKQDKQLSLSLELEKELNTTWQRATEYLQQQKYPQAFCAFKKSWQIKPSSLFFQIQYDLAKDFDLAWRFCQKLEQKGKKLSQNKVRFYLHFADEAVKSVSFRLENIRLYPFWTQDAWNTWHKAVQDLWQKVISLENSCANSAPVDLQTRLQLALCAWIGTIGMQYYHFSYHTDEKHVSVPVKGDLKKLIDQASSLNGLEGAATTLGFLVVALFQDLDEHIQALVSKEPGKSEDALLVALPCKEIIQKLQAVICNLREKYCSGTVCEYLEQVQEDLILLHHSVSDMDRDQLLKACARLLEVRPKSPALSQVRVFSQVLQDLIDLGTGVSLFPH